jgi:hypothetical protein
VRRARALVEDSSPLIAIAQEIPNLQLLNGAENESKGGRLPGVWLESAFSDPTDRAAVRVFHHLSDAGDSLDGFKDFFVARSGKLAKVIRERLGVPEPLAAAELSVAPLE